MELTRSSLRIVINGRPITVGGEAYLAGHGSPDFVVYENTISRWDDGQPVSADDRELILQSIADEAKRQNIKLEVE